MISNRHCETRTTHAKDRTSSMNHRVGRLVFGFGVGFVAALLAYRWAADTGSQAEREMQISVVEESRALLYATLNIGELELVDPLSPDRVVGKGYVYPTADGWEVSGFYRRSKLDLWHPYLVTLDNSMSLAHLKISDTALLSRNGEGVLEVLP
jgi:hypothetical protein